MSQDARNTPEKDQDPAAAPPAHVQPLPDDVLGEVAGGTVYCSLSGCSNKPD